MLRKLSNSKCGANAGTNRTTALALSYSIAEYAAPETEYGTKQIIRCNEWIRRVQTSLHKVTVNLIESLARGYDSPWTTWMCLYRLCTGFTCRKEHRQKWGGGYFEGDATCECGIATENTAHMMQCTLIARPCSLDDLNRFNDIAKKCVERWKTHVL